MNAPWYPLGLIDDPTALGWALVLGLAFGVVLERAGFGSARNLAAQFHGTDMRVLKVMFTAIVTAMLGLLGLAHLGLVDVSLMYLQPTVVPLDVAGGLLIGCGFLIAGYCPGTTVVGIATGRVDALLCAAGLLVGMMVAGCVEPLFSPPDGGAWPGSWGPVTIPALGHWPAGIVALVVTAAAAAACLVAERIESRLGQRPQAAQDLAGATGPTPGRLVLGGLAALAILVAAAGEPQRLVRTVVDSGTLAEVLAREPRRSPPEDIADDLMATPARSRLLDLRPAAPAAERIRGAAILTLADLGRLAWHPQDRLALIADTEPAAAQAWALLTARGVATVDVMAGGWTAWRERVLHPTLPDQPTAEQMPEVERRKTVSRFFGGMALSVGVEWSAPSAPASALPPAATVPALAPVPSSGPPPPPPPQPVRRRLGGGC